MADIGGKVGLTLCSLLGALALGEALVRALDIAPEMLRFDTASRSSSFRLSDNPILGFEMKESVRPEGPSTGRSFRTNSHGQRDIERALEKTGTRILLLGDSVVQGIRTPALDDTISRQLEQLLEPRGIEVLNFGVSGYNTLAEAELFETKGLAFDPDLVILVFVANDQWSGPGDEMKHATYERPPLVNWLLDHALLFRSVVSKLQLFKFGLKKEAVAQNIEALGTGAMAVGLERLDKLIAAQGGQLLILLWPTFDKKEVFYPPFLFPRSGGETMHVEKLATRLGLETFRMAEAFRQDYEATAGEKEPPVTHYTGGPQLQRSVGDGMHPNERASRLAAEAIRDILIANPEYLSDAR